MQHSNNSNATSPFRQACISAPNKMAETKYR